MSSYIRIIACLLMSFALSFEPLSNSAHADILTDASQLSTSNTLIDFESTPLGSTSNPFTVGNVTFSSSAGLAVFNASPYSPTPEVFHNVLCPGGASLIGPWVNMRIDFASPISEIGLGWWDPNLGGDFLQVYNSAGVLLESALIPTGPPGGSFAAFRGIRLSSNQIDYAIVHIASSTELYAIDNVSYGFTSVPEPCGLTLIGSLAVASGVFRRRRRPF